jgi:hypothetical protein
MLLNSMYPSAFWGRLVGATNRILKGRLDTFMALFYPQNYGEIPSEIIDFEYFRHPVTGEEMRHNFNDLWERAQQQTWNSMSGPDLCLSGDLERLGKVINLKPNGPVGVPASSAEIFEVCRWMCLGILSTYIVRHYHHRTVCPRKIPDQNKKTAVSADKRGNNLFKPRVCRPITNRLSIIPRCQVLYPHGRPRVRQYDLGNKRSGEVKIVSSETHGGGLKKRKVSDKLSGQRQGDGRMPTIARLLRFALCR